MTELIEYECLEEDCKLKFLLEPNDFDVDELRCPFCVGLVKFY